MHVALTLSPQGHNNSSNIKCVHEQGRQTDREVKGPDPCSTARILHWMSFHGGSKSSTHIQPLWQWTTTQISVCNMVTSPTERLTLF